MDVLLDKNINRFKGYNRTFSYPTPIHVQLNLTGLRAGIG